MGLQHEIWVRGIEENLFPEGGILTYAVNDDANVKYRKVHLPQAGSLPEVVVNRTVLPATIGTRVDTVESYELQELSISPTRIGNREELEVSYDKRNSVMSDHYNALNEAMQNLAIATYAPPNAVAATNILSTTGASGTANSPSGAIRKLFTYSDVLAAAIALDKQNIPRTNRYLLLPPNLLQELMLDTKVSSSDFTNAKPLPGGTIGVPVAGFTVIVYNHPVVYTTSNAVKTISANNAVAAADSYFALAFHSSMIRRAMGDINVYIDENNPVYYGSIFSADCYFGAKQSRADWKGVISIKQATA